MIAIIHAVIFLKLSVIGQWFPKSRTTFEKLESDILRLPWNIIMLTYQEQLFLEPFDQPSYMML